MPNGNTTQGQRLVGQGRQLAGVARRHPALTLMTNQERLRTSGEAARRLMEGTMMQNRGRQNPYSDLGRYVRTGRIPAPQGEARQREAAAHLRTRGGLGQMLEAQGASKDIVESVEKIEATPGGKELLYTKAAEELMEFQGVPKKDVKKVRLYKYGGAVEQAYAKGGPARAAAERARSAGRGEDEMLVHMTEEEFGVIKDMWGEPDINPNTGLPEYGWLSKIWKGVKKAVKKVVSSKIFQVVAPIALSIFAPGLGAFIGNALAPAASGAIQGVIGNALVQGGLSAAGGGDFVKGALSGAITGGLGQVAGGALEGVLPGVSESTRGIIGSSLAGGTASAVTGGDFVEGALAGATGEMMRPVMEGLTAKGQELFGVQDPAEGGILAERVPEAEAIGALEEVALDEGLAPGEVGPPVPVAEVGPTREEMGAVGGGKPAVAPPTPETGGVQEPGLIEKYAMPALMAASALGGGEYEQAEPPPLPEGWDEPLPLYEMNRQFRGMDPGQYYTYGQAGAPQSGQHLFMDPSPFAGVPKDPTTPTGDMQALIEAGQPIPANLVGLEGTTALTQAGYTQDPNTGSWMPPQSQGLAARGGYQRGGEFDYWEQNADVPRAAPTVSAQGNYVKGGGTGRSDDIPARLSDGEYVIDAETVALLGDGSGDAGARRLDEMRRNLRRHKATNLSKGQFSHKAKEPHKYMARGGMARLRRAMTESGRV